MPDPFKLTKLTEVRKAAGVTLAQMARACGLHGNRSYESASAWERGLSVPNTRLRPKFISYLLHVLGLRNEPEEFQVVWEILMDEWGWEPINAVEWHHYFARITETVSHRRM